MTERMRRLVYWEVDTWEHAVCIARKLPGWVFRGQDNDEWGLETSFERLSTEYGLPIDCRADLEKDIILNFTRQAHHHLRNVPETKDKLEWLALIQHHGGPTRFLDFTESFYAAVFFAVESARRDSIVWAVNAVPLNVAIRDRVDPVTHGRGPSAFQAASRGIAAECLNGRPDAPGAVIVKPWRLNRRMICQQGVFLFPTDITQTFEKNLCCALGRPEASLPTKEDVGGHQGLDEAISQRPDEVCLIKMKFRRHLHTEIMRDLRTMNITSATLFPGLDGFARSFRMSMRLFDGFREEPRAPEGGP